VLGSPVNLAARLQASAVPDTILLSGETYMLLQDEITCSKLPDLDLKGFARPVPNYRLESVKGESQLSREVRRVGRHVAVSIPDRRKIREAIEELRRIETDLQSYLPSEDAGQPDA
jgi:hypothetical protein